MNLEEVSEIAIEFAKKNGYSFTRLESITLVSGKWIVVLDPGLLLPPGKLKIEIEDASGKVVAFKKV